MPTLRNRLCDAIWPLHRQIENNPFMDAVARNAPLEEPYRWLLSRLYPFVLGAEKKLTLLIGDDYGFDLPARMRLESLKTDLQALSIPLVPCISASFDPIDTPQKAIGLLYAMEGSRKGGQFLSSLLQEKTPHLPMNYLSGYKEASEWEWERFCTLLETFARTPDEEQIVSGARSAFEILLKIFTHE